MKWLLILIAICTAVYLFRQPLFWIILGITLIIVIPLYLKKKKTDNIVKQKEIEAIEQAKTEKQNLVHNKVSQFNNILEKIPRAEVKLSDTKYNRNNSFYAECKNLTKATPLGKIKDFVSIDVETTGLKVAGNDIIQVSAVKFSNFEPTEIFSTYTKPRGTIPKEASDINGITDDMVENAPKFTQTIDALDSFIGKLPLVAHNAPFDIKHLFANGFTAIENRTIYDTLQLSRNIIKEAYSYKLQDICGFLDIYFDDAHNSDSDSLAAGLLFVNLVAIRRETTVRALIDDVS